MRISKSSNYLFYDTAYIVSVICIVNVCVTMISPLLSLILDKNGVAVWIIGINAGLQFFGRLFVPLIIPKLVCFMNLRRLILICVAIGLVTVALFLVTSNIIVWCAARFIFGLSLYSVITTCDIWLFNLFENNLHKDKHSTNPSTLGGMGVSVGFVISPAILHITNLDSVGSFVAMLVILLVACIPLAMVRQDNTKKLTSYIPPKLTPSVVLKIIKSNPRTMIIGFVAGGIYNTMATFIPIWAGSLDLNDVVIVNIVMTICVGSVLTQLPVNYLVKKKGYNVALIVTATLGLLASLAVPLLIGSQMIYIPLLMLGIIFISAFVIGTSMQASSFAKSPLLMPAIAIYKGGFGFGFVVITQILSAVTSLFRVFGPFLVLAVLCLVLIVTATSGKWTARLRRFRHRRVHDNNNAVYIGTGGA